MWSPRRSALVAVLVGAVTLSQGGAWAGDPASPSAEARAAAAAKFREGEQAFRRGSFRQAAEAFAASHTLSGHPSPLLNEAIALEQAGEHARAATCYATFLRVAPADAPRRSEAERRRDALAPSLGVVEIVGDSVTDLTVDGGPVDPGDVYVNPGDHDVAGRSAGRSINRRVSLAAGARARLDLASPPEETVEHPVVPPPTPADPTPPRGGGGLHPAWFFAGLGASVGLGALTVWSGLDTQSARKSYDKTPTAELYDEGTGKVTRTNVLLVAGIVTAVATGAIGLFATNWSGGAPRQAGARKTGPAAFVVRF